VDFERERRHASRFFAGILDGLQGKTAQQGAFPAERRDVQTFQIHPKRK
jgi:hypothetical protein